jgi:hypothetical protein
VFPSGFEGCEASTLDKGLNIVYARRTRIAPQCFKNMRLP